MSDSDPTAPDDGWPADVQARLILAQRYTETGFHREAAETYEDISSAGGLSETQRGRMFWEAGRAYRQAGDPARAALCLGQAALHYPAETGLRLELGAASRDARDLETAASAFESVLEIDPAHRGARYGLAEAYGLLNRPEDCARVFMEIEEPAAGESFLAARVWFQRSMRHLGRTDELVTWLDKRAADHPASFIQGVAEIGGRQSLMLVTLPRSGSVYLWRTLAEGLGLPMVRTSLSNFPDDHLVPAQLGYLTEHGGVSQEHLDAKPETVTRLKDVGLTPVVNVRDPRQAMISWLHYLDAEFQTHGRKMFFQDTPENWAAFSFEEKADWCVDNHLPKLVSWIDGWLAAEEHLPGLLFTTFEDMKADESGFFDRLLDHWGIEPAAFSHPHLDEATRRETANFRSGQTDEWVAAFSDDQKARASAIIPAAMKSRFSWID